MHHAVFFPRPLQEFNDPDIKFPVGGIDILLKSLNDILTPFNQFPKGRVSGNRVGRVGSEKRLKYRWIGRYISNSIAYIFEYCFSNNSL